MKVKITPISGTAQVIEFNVQLPGGANASIAPVSTLTATQRWAAIATETDVAAGGERYTQITKLDLVHTLQYTDVNGNINVDLLGNAAKAEMKDKYPDGYVTNIFGKPVKFNDEDITQLLNLFKQFKQNK